MHGPRTFQTAASVLSLRTIEWECGPFKSAIPISYSLQTLPVSPCWFSKPLRLNAHDFQSQMLWGLLLPVQISRVGLPPVGLEPLVPQGRALCLWFPSGFWVTTLRVWVLTRPCLCPSYPSQSGFFFISFCSVVRAFWESCCIRDCSLGVSIGGHELRIFLLHHFPLFQFFLNLATAIFKTTYVDGFTCLPERANPYL